MIPFDTEDEAVRIANDTPYGLTNYVQSQDGARRNRLARQLQAGMVEMNGKIRGAGAPFGGVKASGRAREGGVWGIEEFLEVKAISGWDVSQDMAPNRRFGAGQIPSKESASFFEETWPGLRAPRNLTHVSRSAGMRANGGPHDPAPPPDVAPDPARPYPAQPDRLWRAYRQHVGSGDARAALRRISAGTRPWRGGDGRGRTCAGAPDRRADAGQLPALR